MNIFLCCFQSERDYLGAPYKHWRENFKPPLEAMGHRVLEPKGLDLAAPLAHASESRWIRRYREVTSENLVRQVKETHRRQGIDLFLSYFYSVHVFPDAISEIGRVGIPTVNFFCDNMREFHSVAELVDRYTLNWVPEKEACELYQRRGAAHVSLPMAVNADLYRTSPAEEIPQVTFIGSVDGLRTRLLAEVFPSGLPLKVYGGNWVSQGPATSSRQSISSSVKRIIRRRRKSLSQHWQRTRHYGLSAELRQLATRPNLGTELLRGFQNSLNAGVPHEEMLRLATDSAVLLGINRCPHPGYPLDAPLVYSRLRDIEGPMMGACYLTEYCADLDDMYEVGKEIAVYRNVEELVSEARRLLQDEEARGKLRRLGQRAALSRHTMERRFEVIFRTLGLPDKAPSARKQ